jgi:DNA-binding IscR family transcriptional regulator
VLVVTELISDRFLAGQSSTARWLAETAGLRERTVAAMIERLIERGVLHRLDGDSLTVSLARPPELIPAAEVMEVGFAMVDEAGTERAGGVLKKLRQAQRRVTAGTTLASLGRMPEVT